VKYLLIILAEYRVVIDSIFYIFIYYCGYVCPIYIYIEYIYIYVSETSVFSKIVSYRNP